jgi:hypothetical protein
MADAMRDGTLLSETLALLAGVKPRAPMFSNQILAELFDARHTRGSLKLLPCSQGGFVVFDTRAALGAGVLSWHPTEDEAHGELEKRSA